MKNLPAILVIGLFAWIVVACSKPPAANPYAAAGVVSLENDRGIATLWGIRFEVLEAGTTKASSTSTGTSTSVPEETDVSHELVMGNVTILVEKRPNTPITLTINGRRHGTLELEDEVIIDAKRRVTVNGQVREPQ